MRIELETWQQDGLRARGFSESHVVGDAEPQISLLGLFDRPNDQIIGNGGEPVVFESNCREGVCGVCSFLVNGVPHGSLNTTSVCRQRLQAFLGVMCFWLKPWRSAAFPAIRDLVVDRMTLDELTRAGGTVDVVAGTASDADGVAQGHLQAGWALDFAACIGCGACVAACPNGAAALFMGAKLTHLSLMLQERIEQGHRVRTMMQELDALFGPCSEFGECLPACPAGILIEAIVLLNREALRVGLRGVIRDDQGPLYKQGRVREFVPQVACSYP